MAEQLDMDYLMDTYGPSVLKLAFSYLKDKALAEDIFQEVFLRVHQSLHTICEQRNLRKWILKITANLCRDYLRSWSRRNLIPTDEELLSEEAGLQDTAQEIIQIEQDRKLIEAVMMLPVLLRVTIMLYYYEERNSAEIASIEGISPVTVRIRLYRARKQLKKLLEQEGFPV
jgi:RNA polymerase sigma-70 factor (ECF subfamily)